MKNISNTQRILILIYSIVLLFIGSKIRQRFEPICDKLKIVENVSAEQSRSEKSVDKYVEETTAPDGTRTKRTGEKEFSIDDYLKIAETKMVEVQIPSPPADNFSVDIKVKDIQKFPNVSLKSADIGVRLTDHYWATYSKDFQNGDNIVGVRYTTRVCLWLCP